MNSYKTLISLLLVVVLMISFVNVSFADAGVFSIPLAYKAFGAVLAGMGVLNYVNETVGLAEFYQAFEDSVGISALKDLSSIAVFSIRNNVRMNVRRFSEKVADFYMEYFEGSQGGSTSTKVITSNVFTKQEYPTLFEPSLQPSHDYVLKTVNGNTFGYFKAVPLYQAQFEDDIFELNLYFTYSKFGGTDNSIKLVKNGFIVDDYNPFHRFNDSFPTLGFNTAGSDLTFLGITTLYGSTTFFNNSLEYDFKLNFNIDELFYTEGNSSVAVNYADISKNRLYETKTINRFDVVSSTGVSLIPYFVDSIEGNIVPLPNTVDEVLFPSELIADYKDFVGSKFDELISTLDQAPNDEYIKALTDINGKVLQDSFPKTIDVGLDGVINDVGAKVDTVVNTNTSILSKIGAIANTVVEFFTVPEDYTFSLDFSSFQLVDITEKFPFSLPYDLQRTFMLMVAPPKAPVFEMSLMGNDFVVDFTQFESLALLSRTFFTLIFTVGLILSVDKLRGDN